MKKILIPIGLILIVLLFFWKYFFQGLVPIPADSLVGLYHPYRDYYAKEYPNGIPFKNFLITDPVRQQIPWRMEAVKQIKSLSFPLWNPNSFSGYPLLANIQSAVFYPLNLLLVLSTVEGFFDFTNAWVWLIMLQPLLACLFTYLYLRELKLRKSASMLGAFSFAFGGFSIAWLTWGTLGHVLVWLPLLLLLIEKLAVRLKTKQRFWIWAGFLALFIFAECSMWFAGHLQTGFYVYALVFFYYVSKVYTIVSSMSLSKRKEVLKRGVIFFLFCFIGVLIVTGFQFYSFLQFFNLSGRAFNQANWMKEGWFIPWQNLIQFIAPDFFGNPATLNYFGIWNYGEFIGYIGIAGILCATLALFFRRDKKTFFFGSVFFISLIFATPNILAKIPYYVQIPFLSTSQPTRLLSLVCFSLAVLAALGLDGLLKSSIKKSSVIIICSLLGVLLAVVYGVTILGINEIIKEVPLSNFQIAQRNLILPILLFIPVTALLLLLTTKKTRKNSVLQYGLLMVLLGISIFDLYRFGWKFTPFVSVSYLYPKTESVEYLQKQQGIFRIMSTDNKLFPSNISSVYGIQSIDGYDPLYLSDYAQFSGAWNRGKPDISPLSFNRIITLQDYQSRLADLVNVKYVLSLNPLFSEKLTAVATEGATIVYENKQAFPRAFLVESLIKANDKQEAINLLFDNSIDLRKTAIVYDDIAVDKKPLQESETMDIVSYAPNKIVIKSNTQTNRFLVLTDSFYPTWKAYINGIETSIYKTNYAFRGIKVPSGQNIVEFKNSL